MPETHHPPNDRLMDELLDASLSRYAQAEPRPGLERRVLAGLQAQPEPTGWLWRWLPAAVAAVLVVAAMLYFTGNRASHAPQVAEQPKSVAPAAVAPPMVTLGPATTVSRPARRESRAPRPAIESASPRREQFFRPSAMSAQEAALARFVNQAPPEELQLLARQERAQPIPGLSVGALEIPPVVIGDNDSQEPNSKERP